MPAIYETALFQGFCEFPDSDGGGDGQVQGIDFVVAGDADRGAEFRELRGEAAALIPEDQGEIRGKLPLQDGIRRNGGVQHKGEERPGSIGLTVICEGIVDMDP